MPDWKPVFEPESEEQRSAADHAIVVVHGGVARAVCCDLSEAMLEYLGTTVDDENQAFSPHEAPIDWNVPGDGVWTMRARMVDDGPGDWPGSREVIVQLYGARPTTKEEWLAFCERKEPPWT